MMRYGELVKNKTNLAIYQNMKLKLIIFALLFAIISCSKNDDVLESGNSQQPIGDKPDKISWNYPVLSSSLGGIEQNYIFEYDPQGRVSRKNGGILKVTSSTAFPDRFSNLIYTKISYTDNTAVMGTYSASSSFIAPLNERKFEFDNQGRIIKSVIPSVDKKAMEKHLTYNYDVSGKLVNILTEFPNIPYDPTNPDDYILTYVEKFTYDHVGNLEKAVTIEKHNNVDVYVTKEVECSNFDTAQNPFRKLGIFEDYFYFSLSTNNFNKRIIKEYNIGNLVSTQVLSWSSSYNSNGSVKLFE